MIIGLILLSFPLIYCQDWKHPFFRIERVFVRFFGDNWVFIPDFSDLSVIGF